MAWVIYRKMNGLLVPHDEDIARLRNIRYCLYNERASKLRNLIVSNTAVRNLNVADPSMLRNLTF